MPIDIVAYACTLLRDNLYRNSCIFYLYFDSLLSFSTVAAALCEREISPILARGSVFLAIPVNLVRVSTSKTLLLHRAGIEFFFLSLVGDSEAWS